MSFLAPLFLLGGLAVAFPIIFHLIRRTTREKMPFSSVMFLTPSPPRITRRSRLENLWLLLFRCLVLGVLAFGFARPYFQSPSTPLPQAEAGRRIAVVLDTSASMRRAGLWEAARAKAEQIVRSAELSDQIALLAFDRQVRTIMSFEDWTAAAAGDRSAQALQRLARIEPTWGATRLADALISAAELLEDAAARQQLDNDVTSLQIVLISDLQEGSKLDALQGYEWPRGVELVLEPVETKTTGNAGMQLAIDHAELRPGTNLPVRVRVLNSSDARREQFEIRWAELSGAEPVQVYVPPGQSRLLPLPQDPAQKTGSRLLLAGDQESFDNQVYYVAGRPEQITVPFLGADDPADPTQIAYYLDRGFQETRRHAVRLTPWQPGGPAPQADLLKARFLILSDAPAPDQLQAVRAALDEGKTALLVLRSIAGIRTLEELSGLKGLRGEESDSSRYSLFGQIQFTHPLFAPFADPRYSDFTRIQIWKHRRLDQSQWKPEQVLARLDNNDPALLELPAGKGKLYVLTFGWHPADSQLALSSKFVPLLYSFLEQSGAYKGQDSQFFVGDEVPLPGNDENGARIVVKPDGTRVEVESGKPFDQTDVPGIYRILAQPAPIDFAVNLLPDESRTGPIPFEELERLGVPLKPEQTKTPKAAAQERHHLLATELEQRQKVWRWLIVAALVLLAFETWLAGRVTNRAAPATV